MILSLWKKLLNFSSSSGMRSRRGAPARPRRRTQLHLEPLGAAHRFRPAFDWLEERCLLAGTLTTLTIALNGRQETPPQTTAAHGAGTIVFDSTANTMSLDVFMTGIKLANVNGIQLHRGPAGVNDSVVVNLLGFGSLSANGTG